MAEIMFEEFQVPAFYIANTGVLNAYVHLVRWDGKREVLTYGCGADLQLEKALR